MDFSPRGAPPRTRVGWFLLSKVLVFTLNTYLRHCIGMYRACIGMYPGARPKSLCDDTIPVDTREIHRDTTYRTPAPSPPDPIHRYSNQWSPRTPAAYRSSASGGTPRASSTLAPLSPWPTLSTADALHSRRAPPRSVFDERFDGPFRI